MKKIISTVLTALTVISLTGCNKTVASVEAKSTSIEYGKDKVKTVDLLDTENTDSIQGDPEEIDASKVGDVDVSYSSKGKDAGTIHYTVKDTKIPVLKIGEEELSAKTKAKIDSKITAEDEVDGQLKKLDKLPTSKSKDSEKIGVSDYYDEGWYVVDLSKVDTSKNGEYDAKATTADKHGNTVIVNYKVTVSDDGKKANKETSIEVQGTDGNYKVDKVQIDNLNTTLTEINDAGMQQYQKEHSDTVTEIKTSSDGPSKVETPKNDKKEDSKKTEEKQDTASSSNNTNSNSSASTTNNSQNSGNSSNNNNSGNSNITNTSSQPAQSSGSSNSGEHVHTWVEWYEPVHYNEQFHWVHHNEVGHYEGGELIQEAYYDPGYRTCNLCGLDSRNVGDEAFDAHASYCAGTYEVHYGEYHPAVYSNQTWVVDTPAYDEKVVDRAGYDDNMFVGYKCSTCGATKGKN